jgi:phage shock protein E
MSRRPGPSTAGASAAGRRSTAAPSSGRRRLYLSLAGGAVVLFVAAVLTVVALSSAPSGSTGQTVTQGHGGSWTNVTPDRLAQMLESKDFTFVNVKTPYMGEIEGTDLYIPYDQLSARTSELPQGKGAKLLVYCRSGGESAIAAQTLLDLGYTNVWNLDGGMIAWQSSGRTLVQKAR